MALEYGTGGNEEAMLHTRDRYAEGYKAGRIAALREVGCYCSGELRRLIDPSVKCKPCRLLAEAESGEQEREVGGEG